MKKVFLSHLMSLKLMMRIIKKILLFINIYIVLDVYSFWFNLEVCELGGLDL